jgi:GDP-L-fucose synthase
MSAKEKVILVTGGGGLVGHGIRLALEQLANGRESTSHEQWIYLRSSDGDLRSLDACKAIFEKHRPTHVIHLAARVGGLFANMKYKVEFFRENMAINDNVLHCCHVFDVQKCVSCMSTCIFPDKTSYPINEKMLHDGAPHSSNEGYAHAKRMIDVLNRCYNEQHGCRFTSIIPTNIFGPHDNFNVESGHVIPGLIHKCLVAEQESRDFVVWGSGAPLRQFVYSVDLGRLIVWVLDSYDDIDPIILSVSEEAEVSIRDVALSVAAAMQFKGNVVFDTSKSDGQFKKTADNSKLMSLCPDFKFTPVDEALELTCRWFRDNYGTPQCRT